MSRGGRRSFSGYRACCGDFRSNGGIGTANLANRTNLFLDQEGKISGKGTNRIPFLTLLLSDSRDSLDSRFEFFKCGTRRGGFRLAKRRFVPYFARPFSSPPYHQRKIEGTPRGGFSEHRPA